MSTWFIASAGEEPWHREQVQDWQRLATLDAVRRHVLVDDPADAQHLLFVDLHQHPDDPYLRVLRRHPLVRRHRERVVVHDRRDRPTFTFPGMYVSAERPRRGVVGGPYPALHTQVRPSAQEPDLLWSFAGARTHPVRDALYLLPARRAVVRDTTGLAMFAVRDAEEQVAADLAREDYRALLARSKFVLCPRGHGASSYRLFETLAAGRVPVVLSDSWLAPPGIDWSAAAVVLPEARVREIPDLLESLEHVWPEMAEQARRVWDRHLADDRLWDYVAGVLADVPRPARRPWWAERSVVRRAAAGALHARPQRRG